MSFIEKIQKAWNAFNKDPTPSWNYGMSYGSRPDRARFTRGNEKSLVNSVYNRIALDSAAIKIEHIKNDNTGRYIETYNSKLNQCLSISANLDQTGRAFIQDVVMSMLDEGCVAIIPTETSENINSSNSFDIYSMRTAKVLEWYPAHVKVKAYDERFGKYEEIIVPKSKVCLIENPLYSVMNEPNSTLQRLIRKLNLLDVVDEQSGSSKLDLIIQLPYTVKTQAKKDQASERKKQIEDQLANSKYGIAYIDSTEHITQLNRSVENNLMAQIEYLTKMLYSQLGLTAEIMDGSANATTINNYYNRTIEPILSAITDEMTRKFLTKTAITQGQAIDFFREPFKLLPVDLVAEFADKFTRNEIMTSNEIRQVIGMRPSNDPKADELRNSNISMPDQGYDQGYQDGLYDTPEDIAPENPGDTPVSMLY